MDDLEIRKLCASAMRIYHWGEHDIHTEDGHGYNPLHDDAQMAALVKKFRLSILYSRTQWLVSPLTEQAEIHADLNRAVCLCVAKIERAKREGAGK